MLFKVTAAAGDHSCANGSPICSDAEASDDTSLVHVAAASMKTKKAKHVNVGTELKSAFHVAELTASKGVDRRQLLIRGPGDLPGMVIGTSDPLVRYVLSTDKEYYNKDESVEVIWDITDAGVGLMIRAKSDRRIEPEPIIDDDDVPEPIIDDDDVTLYRLGIYMRKFNPQGGQLAPLLDHAFCASPCTAPPEELMTGKWTFAIKDLPDPHPLSQGQYDVWILNGQGDGIAGPVTFKLKE